MVQSLQLSELAGSIREDAIQQLQAVADSFSLSYVIEEDTMTITLPKYDVAELPVVTRLDLTEDDVQAPDSTGGD